jgi:hypothetical protein
MSHHVEKRLTRPHSHTQVIAILFNILPLNSKTCADEEFFQIELYVFLFT